MTRVLFLLRRLEGHGAERQLVELVAGLDKSKFAITIVTFYRGGALEDQVLHLPGVTLVCLNKTGRWDVLRFCLGAASVVRRIQPHIIHGYLTMPNLVALGAGTLSGARVVWGIRSTYADISTYGWLGRLELTTARALSGFADLVIFNSQSSRDRHVALGYKPESAIVIPNGVDISKFAPRRDAGEPFRAQWQATKNDRVVAIVGRVNPIKDFDTFIRAAVLTKDSRLRFVSIGEGSGPYFEEMQSLARRSGLGNRMRWVGAVTDMPAALNAVDVLVSSSFDEGTPNVVGEAMACGIPCVVTNVGDSALLVGNAGVVVPPRDAAAIATALDALANDDDNRLRLGEFGRQRIERNFAMANLVTRTEAALIGLRTA